MFLKLCWNRWAFKLLRIYYRLSKQESPCKAHMHMSTFPHNQSLNVSYLTSNSTSILSWENTISEKKRNFDEEKGLAFKNKTLSVLKTVTHVSFTVSIINGDAWILHTEAHNCAFNINL